MRPPAEEPPSFLEEGERGITPLHAIALEGEREGVGQAGLDRGDGDALRAGVLDFHALDRVVNVDLLQRLGTAGVGWGA